MKKLRWGVLGTAKIAIEKVIPAMQNSDLCDIVAIASRSEDKAYAAANRLGIATAYGSYEALLDDDSIDAVYNPLPNHLHVPMTLMALAHSKHVLCEKPIALTASEAETLRTAANESGLVVAEGFMVRHHPQWQTARKIVQSGRIGDVRAMQVFFSYYTKDPTNVRNQADIGGGGLYDVGCYAINISRYIFGVEPGRAIGLFDMDPDLGTDRITSGLVDFADGRRLTFTCATQLSPYQSATIVGTKGRIEISIPFAPAPDATTTITVDDGRDLNGGGADTIEIAPCDQYRLQGDAFARSVLEARPLAATLDDAVANMRVIDALFRSAKSQGWETV